MLPGFPEWVLEVKVWDTTNKHHKKGFVDKRENALPSCVEKQCVSKFILFIILLNFMISL